MKKAGTRLVNDIIYLLHNENFSLSLFREKCCSSDDVRARVESIFEQRILLNGFREVGVPDPQGRARSVIFTR